MILNVTKLGQAVLRQKATPVEEITDETRKLAEDMFETMEAFNGVGLACPQIGLSKRMFVAMADDGIKRVFINPQILKTSQELSDYDEGCLSIPQVYETITRPKEITVQAFNEMGKPFTLEADGLLARVIQHEYDHLDGIVFIDRGDEEFAKKTIEQFEKRLARAAEKEKLKAAKQAKIAAKIAAKQAKKG